MLLLFTHILRFKRFRGFGFEAELWEEKQEEAGRLIDILKTQSIIISKHIMRLSASSGRFSATTPPSELFDLSEKINKSLTLLGASESEKINIMESLYYYTAIDMAHIFINDFNTMIEREAKRKAATINEIFGQPTKDPVGYQNAQQEVNEIRNQKIDFTNIASNFPDPSSFQHIQEKLEYARKLPAKSQDGFFEKHSEAIKDLKYWLERKELRRPNVWLSQKGR